MKKKLALISVILAVLSVSLRMPSAAPFIVTSAAALEPTGETVSETRAETESEDETESVADLAQNATDAKRFPDPEEDELNTDPADISGVIGGSFAASLYGAALSVEQNWTPITLSNLVLAGKVAPEELGKFDIRYTLTAEEYDMLLFCVDHETRNGSLEHKSLIAQVVMNRVQGQRFPFTVRDVLMAPHQFDVMPWYENRSPDWVPSQVTRNAVDWVLSGTSPDFAQGAVYFCNPYIVGEGNWFDTALTAICEIQGHRFYKP
ncbi:MAG: cell wall hydrolase [Clostridia bacterium]|nr:cell wall hydrolase [Clostridia bacterium]